jgi:hypothetical protein
MPFSRKGLAAGDPFSLTMVWQLLVLLDAFGISL